MTKADFWEAPPVPLCVQALALQFLRWAAASVCPGPAGDQGNQTLPALSPWSPGQLPHPEGALLTWRGWRIWSGIPVQLLHKLLSYDICKESGCSAAAGTCSQIINAYHWLMKLLWMLLLPGVMGNLGFLVSVKAVWKVRCQWFLCTNSLLWRDFAPGAVELCTTAWAKHLCTVDSFCFSAEILLKLLG